MQGESRAERRRLPRRLKRSRRNVALATAIAALSTLSASAGVAHVNAAAPEDDVAEWFDEVDSAMVVDKSPDCMSGTSETVFYRGDRIVIRSTAGPLSNDDAKTAVNNALNGIYINQQANDWATKVERIEFPQPDPGPPIRPVLSVSLEPRSDEKPHAVVELARELRREPGMLAAPDYGLVTATPYSFFWPKGYPRPITELTPARKNTTGVPIGTGIKMAVFDVGIAPRAPGVLPNVAPLIPADNEQIDIDGDTIADYPPAGHGLAIAGVISTLVPGVVIQEMRVSDRNGLATDVSAARRIATSLRNMPQSQWPSLIVNAFGTTACDFDLTTPGLQLEPVGLKTVVEVTDRFDPQLTDGFFIVASAGNENSSRETYPAAFDSVLGVGALDTTVDANGDPWTAEARTGPKAEFSNHGDWVDAWAPGVSLPTNHVTGVAFEKGLSILDGKAEVDGTSYSAPYVAGLIAEQMSTVKGPDARAAWEEIAKAGADPLAECGASPQTAPDGVAVALVSMSSAVTATTPGSGSPVVC